MANLGLDPPMGSVGTRIQRRVFFSPPILATPECWNGRPLGWAEKGEGGAGASTKLQTVLLHGELGLGATDGLCVWGFLKVLTFLLNSNLNAGTGAP